MFDNELQGFLVVKKGLPISPGYAIGKAFCIRHFQLDTVPTITISEQDVDHEIWRFQNALRISRTEILNLLDLPHIKSSLEIANIFQAHLALLEDPDLKKEVEKRIRERRLNVESILSSVIKDFSEFFRKLPDPQFQGKAIDIIDVGQRILRNCELEPSLQPLANLKEGVIIIAENLTPSEIVDFDPRWVRGIAIEEGTPTSHAAILARSLSIPAVIQVKNLLQSVSPGDLVFIDGVNGFLVVNPDEKQICEFNNQIRVYESNLRSMQEIISQPSVTKDGKVISLQANIGKLQDIDAVITNHADGIGLYRTEFAYLTRRQFPTEDELVEVYSTVVSRISPKEVIFRTLDLGGEKLPLLGASELEKNPELGWRAVRMALDRPDLMRTQFRAILRASLAAPNSRVKILLPMISNLQEFRQCRAILAETQRELSMQGLQLTNPVPVGIMVEIPSAALMARAFAREVDFFSIGSNDLIQYTLAVDRTNSKVAHLYQPSHPAVLRLIREVTQAAYEAGKPVTICGEMAGDPKYTSLLIGLGLRSFSMNPVSIMRVKQAVRSCFCQEAERVVESVLACSTAEEVENLLKQSGLSAERSY